MRNIISDIAAQLSSAYPADEAKALAWWVAEELTGLTRTQLLTTTTDAIPATATTLPDAIPTTLPGQSWPGQLASCISRLLAHEPIQYIFGHTEWAGLDLQVSPDTLIPRPETAEIVEAIKTHLHLPNRPLRAIDIGTGTGCIALLLKRENPEWDVIGVDFKQEIVDLARLNADKNALQVGFAVLDILQDSSREQIGDRFDLIVSNPPYIRESEKSTMSENVLRYEPTTALFVPDSDPLLFYRKILEIGVPYVAFEVNEALANETAELAKTYDYCTTIVRDSYDKLRFVLAEKLQKN